MTLHGGAQSSLRPDTVRDNHRDYEVHEGRMQTECLDGVCREPSFSGLLTRLEIGHGTCRYCGDEAGSGAWPIMLNLAF